MKDFSAGKRHLELEENEEHVMATSSLIQIFSAVTVTGQIHSATLVCIKAGVISLPFADSRRTLFSVNLCKPQIRSNNHNGS